MKFPPMLHTFETKYMSASQLSIVFFIITETNNAFSASGLSITFHFRHSSGNSGFDVMKTSLT